MYNVHTGSHLAVSNLLAAWLNSENAHQVLVDDDMFINYHLSGLIIRDYSMNVTEQPTLLIFI